MFSFLVAWGQIRSKHARVIIIFKGRKIFRALKKKKATKKYDSTVFKAEKIRMTCFTLPRAWSEPFADAPKRTEARFDSAAAPPVNKLLWLKREVPILDLFCNSNYQKPSLWKLKLPILQPWKQTSHWGFGRVLHLEGQIQNVPL